MEFNWQATGTIVSIIGILLVLGRDAINGSWKLGSYLSAMEKRISDKIDENKKTVDIALSQVEAEFEKRCRELEAELAKRIRETEAEFRRMERWATSEFVRRQSFTDALQRIEKITDRLDLWLRSMQLRGRVEGPPDGHGQAG